MDLITSYNVVKSLSLENIRNLEGFARTTVSDYYIQTSSFKFKNTIFKNNKVSIYEADWKFSRVCVKKISLQANTIMDDETKKNIQKRNRRHSLQNIIKSKKNETSETEDLNNEKYNELLLLSKCIHPKIVQFFGFSKDNDSLYLIFEYMVNGNLQDYVKSYSLTIFEKIDILIDVTIALHYLHTRYPNKIMHRDIKPSNILLNEYKQAKLSDFGISKIQNKNDRSHDNSSEKGTYIWMAPEVLIGNAYNQTADIYSLGLVMYFLFSENLPFYQYNLNMVQLMLKKSKYEVELNLDEIKNAQLKYLIGMCVSRIITERPTAEYIIKVLYDILDDIEKN